MPRRPVVVSVVLVVLTLLAAGLAPPAGAGTDELTAVAYRPPVDGPIVDRFDLPAQRWQPGNRGVDYGVAAGTVVAAAGDGEVVFAGAVAGTLHVTVRHADGLRTSYSFLAEVSVHVGQKVRAGQPVGVAGGPVHVGVRTPDGTYLDPEALFAGALEPHVRLVPGAEDGLDPLAERRSLLDTLLDTGAAAAAYLTSRGTELAELAVHYAVELDPATHAQRAMVAGWRWWQQLRDCTPTGATPPPPVGRRIAVVVSGLGSDSGSNSAWEIDTSGLGYDPDDVVRFSYAGGQAPGPDGDDGARPPTAVSTGGAGRTEGPTGGLDAIPTTAFTETDSQQSVGLSADRLAELLREVGRAEPGVPIDVIAHSQGGVVARLGVVRAGADGSLPVGVENLVTLGSPHQGAPLATGIVALHQSTIGTAGLDALRVSQVVPDLDDRLPAMTDLAETSPVISELHATPIPDGVRFTSIGAAGDVVVPGTVTADRQADTHVVLPSGFGQSPHGDLVRDPRALREVLLAVEGRPPGCQSFGEAASTFAEAELIRTTETALAVDLATAAMTGDVALPVPPAVLGGRG